MTQKTARLAFFPASLVHSLIDDLDDVELVKRQLCRGKILSCSLDERGRHVTAQLPDVLWAKDGDIVVSAAGGYRSHPAFALTS